MDNDDRPVGRILSRREALALLGAAGAAALAACAPEQTATPIPIFTDAATGLPAATAGSTGAPATATSAALATAAPTTAAEAIAAGMCIVRPELSEGPYFVDEMLNRSDIRADPADGSVKAGLPLALAFRVSRLSGAECAPLAGAQVDIWHCDAAGAYSDVIDRGSSTVGQKFLRGYQLTDANGVAQFLTIYPGWYSGRAVHIHFKIRTDAGLEFTSQLFFDDDLSRAVYANEPYAAKGEQNTPNATDGLYRQGGSQLLLDLTETADGYAALFDIGMELA
jgi:protocatechuate 3,4-dioxygenase beta subunit